MTGRIFGIQNTVLSAVLIIAPLLGGLLVEFAGPGRIFLIFGLIQTALGVAGLVFGRILWQEKREGKASRMEQAG
ncbi:hypothetical protein D3C76_1732790 [compost metagenome]